MTKQNEKCLNLLTFTFICSHFQLLKCLIEHVCSFESKKSNMPYKGIPKYSKMAKIAQDSLG